jgi:glycosyltransferase involved in cell wall biosynthesis
VSSRRVTVVTSEVLGAPGTGGPGTADSLLALALGRHGHRVELLVAPGRDLAVGSGWERIYADANVRVRVLAETRRVRPDFLAPTAHVYEALRADPPEVVVADDWRALPYAALRSRQLGAALQDTAFVLYSHGPARVFAAAARKVPDTVARFGEEVAQRACVELADAVVSPSHWLVGWLREHRWPVDDRMRVIQNLWESTALGVPPRRAPAAAIRRLAFFGQIRKGKGIRVYLDSLRRLEPRLLDGVELIFLGHSRSWTADKLQEELGRPVRLETGLDRTGAVDELSRPGTLAVMPSLLENSPYAVAECIEHGIPFLASNVGGTPELVAEQDRARVLCEPRADAFAAALAQALTDGHEPAHPAREPEQSLAAWLDLVGTVTPRARPAPETPDGSEWTLFGVDEDGLFEALLSAQAASGADVVTTGVRTPDGTAQLFLGDPGPLGLIENQYGVTGLVRRSDLTEDTPWVLCARLAAQGARIVSLPDAPLAYEGSLEPANADRLAVLEAFEHADPELLRNLPQLTATLAAALGHSDGQVAPSRLGRIRRRLLG